MSMSRPHVALATATAIGKDDFDAPPLVEALARHGITAQVLAWDDPAAQAGFAGARACVLRSTWNYVQKFEAFLPWVNWCAGVTRLWNPAATVRWNSHKEYLLELAARGIPVVPTTLIRQGTTAAESAAALVEALARWGTVVIKPAISAGSFATIRVQAGAPAAGIAHLGTLLQERDMLVQRYEASVSDHGERSLIWIDGQLCHAIRKNPRFVGQPESVSPQAVPIGADERALAEQVIALAPQPLLYARVDLVRDGPGSPQLMELELIEPSLFFAQHPASADRLAAAIARLM
jgi:O-ureido-D-serine cyclo-ligase